MATVKLGDIAIEAKSSNKDDKTGIRIVGLEHLTPSNVTLSSWSEDTENTFTKEFSKGDVLFGRRRAYLKKAAVAPFDGICSGDITVIRAIEDKVDSDLLPFIIQNDFLFEFAVGKSAGSLSPRVKWTHLKEFAIELPSMPEQSKLAETLWSIIETKNAYEDLINKTDELVKSQFIEMFSACQKVKLGSIADISAGQSSPKDGEFSENGIPFIKARDLEGLKLRRYSEYNCNLVTKEVAKKKKLKLHDVGTILVAKSGMSCNSGHIYILQEESYVVSHLACIKPCDRIPPNFIKVFFNVTGVQNLIKDASYPSIQLGQFADMQVPNAPDEVMSLFDSFVEQSDKSKFALQEAIKNLDALSKKIIAENLIPDGKE